MSEWEPRWNLEDIAQGIACGYCGAYGTCRCEPEPYDPFAEAYEREISEVTPNAMD